MEVVIDKNACHRVVSGEVNLFIRSVDEAQPLRSIYLMTLQPADVFCGLDLGPSLALVAVGENVKFEQAAKADAEIWLKKLADLVEASPELISISGRLRELLEWVDTVENEQLKQTKLHEESILHDAMHHLASLDTGHAFVAPTESKAKALQSVCDIVFAKLGIDAVHHGFDATIEQIAQGANVRTRQVSLADGWWRRDCGPLVGFWANQNPVALFFEKQHYVAIDGITGQKIRLDSTLAKQIVPAVHVFYRPLPEQNASKIGILKWSLKDRHLDLSRLLLVTVTIGLFSLVLPISLGLLFDFVIPSGSLEQLGVVVASVVVAGVISAMLSVAQLSIIARLTSRIQHDLQSAIVDRLLNLPARFFRFFQLGDLASRAQGVNAIRGIVSDATIQTFLTGLGLMLNILVLFIVSPFLAWLSLLMLAVQAATLAANYYLQSRQMQALGSSAGRIAGFATELLSGISKLRSAGAERRAFANFAALFLQYGDGFKKIRRYAHHIVALGLAFEVIFVALIAAAAIFHDPPLTIGGLLAFVLAFVNFLLGMRLMGESLLTALRAVPYVDAMEPILLAPPEATKKKSDPGELIGKIEVSQLSFGYSETGREILRDVNLSIEAGQMVAIVGPSGAGKSTLMRLMLGFEEPKRGRIFYDGQDLSTIKPTAVRRQLGVVLQNGRLFAGTILNNIIGASLLTEEDAWQAARLVGLEPDIRALPMGMQTVISEVGGGLSGGQRQLILIARAIVRKPKVIFFDEATSQLDRLVQDRVTKSLAAMNVTRVIIAHRLSTIKDADHIYVIDKGQVVQSGVFAELAATPGLFAELAQRQLA